MTKYGYHMVMKGARIVRIAELKAHLSEYLRTVRGGHTVTVLDRDTPVAKIVPIRQPGLRVRKPGVGAPPPNRVVPPPSDLKLDVLELLLEERQGQR
jgi:prevent-host-death family protein